MSSSMTERCQLFVEGACHFLSPPPLNIPLCLNSHHSYGLARRAIDSSQGTAMSELGNSLLPVLKCNTTSQYVEVGHGLRTDRVRAPNTLLLR